MELSKTSSLDSQCPLKHSTPNAAVATNTTNPAKGLPRAKVATTTELGRRSVDLTNVLQGGRTAATSEATWDAMQSSGRRVTMPAFPQVSLSQPTPEPTFSTSPNSLLSFQKEASFTSSLSGVEKEAKSKRVSTSRSSDKSGNVERSPSPELLPRASISMDMERSSEAPNDQPAMERSAEVSRQTSGLSLPGAFQSQEGKGSHKHKKSPVSTPPPPVEETEETEDIVRSFEEAIAASPTVSTTRMMVTDSPISGSDMDASSLLTPQWIRDAAARKRTRMLEGASMWRVCEREGAVGVRR